jgi:hypothetical protein
MSRLNNGGKETIAASKAVYETAHKIVEVIEQSEIADTQSMVAAVIKVVAITYNMKAE